MGHLTHTVNVPGIGPVDVSTIDLATSGLPGATGIETCLFWPASGELAEGNEVVATYGSWPEARAAHAAFCNPTVLGKLLRTIDGFRATSDALYAAFEQQRGQR